MIPLENEEPKEDVFPPDLKSQLWRDVIVEVRARVNGSCMPKPKGLSREPVNVNFDHDQREVIIGKKSCCSYRAENAGLKPRVQTRTRSRSLELFWVTSSSNSKRKNLLASNSNSK